MSIIKSIKQVLGLGPAAENHFWDGSVPNQLSLKRGTPEAPGAELIKALNGVLSFPNQGQSLTDNGYVKLPGGLIVQWGASQQFSGGNATVTFPIAFPGSCQVVYQVAGLDGNWSIGVTSGGNTTQTVSCVNNSGVGANSGNAWYIAIGY